MIFFLYTLYFLSHHHNSIDRNGIYCKEIKRVMYISGILKSQRNFQVLYTKYACIHNSENRHVALLLKNVGVLQRLIWKYIICLIKSYFDNANLKAFLYVIGYQCKHKIDELLQVTLSYDFCKGKS